ncbi:MAG TPA: response regulator transcription factor [Gaiellaceae bacterium]|nr:response regulator transcription factor [Gaiellaceae bacterium]
MRLVLADDHALFRAGIASLVRAWGHEVAGEAQNGLEALDLARKHHPDLVLMDITMPECNGLEATRLIKAELPEIRIAIVTVSDHDEDLFEAIKSGAEGYLLKDMDEGELEATLRALEAGEPALSPRLAGKILEEFARIGQEKDSPAAGSDELTPREQEVLQLVAEGLTNKEIASTLFLSEHTVNFHVKNILSKLHLRNRAQAVAYAVRSGLAKPADDA